MPADRDPYSGNANQNAICVEPEDGKWPIQLFADLLDAVEAEVANHPLQKHEDAGRDDVGHIPPMDVVFRGFTTTVRAMAGWQRTDRRQAEWILVETETCAALEHEST